MPAWNVKIIRHPRMSEYIDVTTQAYKMRGFYGYRRYSIIDEQGATIVSAEAIWILMNTQKMLPMKVTKEIADIYVENIFCPQSIYCIIYMIITI